MVMSRLKEIIPTWITLELQYWTGYAAPKVGV